MRPRGPLMVGCSGCAWSAGRAGAVHARCGERVDAWRGAVVRRRGARGRALGRVGERCAQTVMRDACGSAVRARARGGEGGVAAG